ncbi:MAG: acyl carrier protein, partial [Clostridia bacterium]|nr:acyl carrier protein [Clostridia bacterium]
MATFEQIKDIIVEALQCDAEIVQPEAKINEDLGADSLDMVELIMALEESFSIKIADEHT